MTALFHQATTQRDGIAFVYETLCGPISDLLTGAERLSRASWPMVFGRETGLCSTCRTGPKWRLRCTLVFASERSRARRTCG